MTNKTDKKRPGAGFAAMDPERLREMSALGGRTAHLLGKAHQFTSEEAREAAKKKSVLQLSKQVEKRRETLRLKGTK